MTNLANNLADELERAAELRQGIGTETRGIMKRSAELLRQQSRGDLIDYITRHRNFSAVTFGPGPRAEGVCKHIEKELTEIRQAPDDLTEWVDVIILAIDGAWRAGHSPEQIADALNAKLERNKARKWPDWRGRPVDQPIEHVRVNEAI